MTMATRQLEPLAQRVRARIGKLIILDTIHAQLLSKTNVTPGGPYPKRHG